MSKLKKWFDRHPRKSIFDPTDDRLELIVVHMITQKGRPHGYEK